MVRLFSKSVNADPLVCVLIVQRKGTSQHSELAISQFGLLRHVNYYIDVCKVFYTNTANDRQRMEILQSH